MTEAEAMQALEAAGKEQTRKTWRRHGITGEMFGVLYGDLGKLKKRIKVDHALAGRLWATGNHDARILATMVADPRQADDAQLDGWASDLRNNVEADALSDFVGKTSLARAKAEQWIGAEGEWIAIAGWNLLGQLALHNATLPDDFFEPYLDTIERDIHAQPNWVRYAMNSALIAIGQRNAALEQRALDVAAHIGTVQVDHGQTCCKTPDAATYIAKTRKHRARREGVPA